MFPRLEEVIQVLLIHELFLRLNAAILYDAFGNVNRRYNVANLSPFGKLVPLKVREPANGQVQESPLFSMLRTDEHRRS